jgi:hypothetical protein
MIEFLLGAFLGGVVCFFAGGIIGVAIGAFGASLRGEK